MKSASHGIILIPVLLLAITGVQGQKPLKKEKKAATHISNPQKKITTPRSAPADTAKNSADNEKKVRSMVAFLEYMLNTLGSSSTSRRDKDVLITQSYSKIFNNATVQVEDDLDPDRQIVTYKNIVAYLKDVDFFFSDVKFEFTIDKVQAAENAAHQLYYTVSLKRNLHGTTADGKEVNNTITRYIEINYNPDSQDFRIASIYTHELNPKEALMNWWKQLSDGWQTVFRAKLPSKPDSISYDDLRTIVGLDSLSIAGNQMIRNVDPLERLTALQVLDLSSTAVTDLNAVRDLTELRDINIANTKIQDLSPLKYSVNLKRLTIRNTIVNDISIIEKMVDLRALDASTTAIADASALATLTSLEHLNLRKTMVLDLSPLRGLTGLLELNLANTQVRDVGPLQSLKKLTHLNLDSTSVSDVGVLSGLDNLVVLRINGSPISNLKPLLGLAHLEKIYCDRSLIKAQEAEAFMAANKHVLVVFDSDDLKAWWETLSDPWKRVLSVAAHIAVEPTKDELATISSVDSINIAGQRVNDLVPLVPLLKLRVLIANNTEIQDLSPLRDHVSLRYLDISETGVSDLSIVRDFSRISVVRADKSKVENLSPLFDVASLKAVYVDQTSILDIAAREFLEHRPACLIVYKTIHLNRWWKKLPSNWRDVFRSAFGSDTTASRENMHRLVERESFHFADVQVSDLLALSEFVRLKELQFSGTAITDLAPLTAFPSLRLLHATDSPLQQVTSLSQLTALEDLDISNSPVDELKWIADLQRLKKFNCSGTQVRKLDPLRALNTLEYLDCSNTRVGNLDPASHESLKTVKCYNTRISAHEVANFKKSNPGCNVIYYR